MHPKLLIINLGVVNTLNCSQVFIQFAKIINFFLTKYQILKTFIHIPIKLNFKSK